MGDERKIRGDALLNRLRPKQQEAVFAHCETVSLDAGVKWIEAEFDITISTSRLGVWLEKRRSEASFRQQLDELRADAAFAKMVTKEVSGGADLGDANAALLQQMVFEMMRLPKKERDKSAKKIGALMKHALKAREQELKARSLDLEAEKFKSSIRTKLETGLDALAKEIQGNARALKFYTELREELKAAA